MTFNSILSERKFPGEEAPEAPSFFTDLNLDQVIDAVTAGKNEYKLKPLFYSPLNNVETIYYRHEVMRDMEDPTQMANIKTFTEKMGTVRRYLGLAERLDYNYHKKGWFLEAVLFYCQAVADLGHNLELVDLKSHGFLGFRQYVTKYIQSRRFQSLLTEAQRVKESLAAVKYCVIIQSGKFTVQKYEEETDYSVEVEMAFDKFQQGVVKDYRVKLNQTSGMNHIEAQILNFVARLYPEQFASLEQFNKRHGNFMDETVRTFDREIQFYVSYLEFIADFKRKGFPFCYPRVSASIREVFATDAFDLALARSLLHSDQTVVFNDFQLEEPERIFVVSGANQGGKTTFARMFGQLNYLASLGCPVPGKQAQLFLFDQIYTHFEKVEDIQNLRGKLQDDMVRIHNILDVATPDSILILNEIFASTTWQDAVFLSKEIMARVMDLDLLCVWVTFIDELSSLNEKTVSMVSTVVPENPALRTYKIMRTPADGLAYALSIAKKHRLTYPQIKERINP